MHRRLIHTLSTSLCIAVAPALLASPLAEPAAETLAYRLEPREALKYRLVADVKGSLPLGESPEPADVTAKLSLTYTAVPKTRLSDGTSDVDFEVANVDFEVLKFPIAVPDDMARDHLNLTITLAKNGEVLKVHAKDKELPFSVSVPGVDPKRLYALIFPIVFRKTPVKQGETWDYKSELLGGQGTAPRFSATLLPPAQGSAAAKTARLKQQFEMPVDVKKDKDKKPVTNAEDAHRAQTGKIDGDGVFLFDKQKGRVTHGDVNIRVNIKDTLVGKPLDELEPKEILTHVEAKVKIDLLAPAPGHKPAPDAPSARGDATAQKAAKKEKP